MKEERTVIICDRCGSEVDPEDNLWAHVFRGGVSSTILQYFAGSPEISIDLCAICRREFTEWWSSIAPRPKT